MEGCGAGFPTGVANMGVGGGDSSKFDGGGGGVLSQNMGGAWGSLNCCQKYLWISSFDSKVAGCKPASLQIFKNELLHTYFARILARF